MMNVHICLQSWIKYECIPFHTLWSIREHVDLICMLSQEYNAKIRDGFISSTFRYLLFLKKERKKEMN
jgi:hypothetical protein